MPTVIMRPSGAVPLFTGHVLIVSLLLAAFLTWRAAPELQIQGGLFYVPLSRSTLTGSARYLTLDAAPVAYLASVPTQSVSMRDTGFGVLGYFLKDRLHYRLGVYQGRREAGSRSPFRYAARLQYEFFDTESRARTSSSMGGSQAEATGGFRRSPGNWSISGRTSSWPAEIDAALAAVEPGPALVVGGDSMLTASRDRIAKAALARRLPAAGAHRSFAEAGGLMSYGQSRTEVWRKLASYIDKIVKGTSPADLPVEQPTRLELVINMKTARMLGIELPAELLLLADKVVE